MKDSKPSVNIGNLRTAIRHPSLFLHYLSGKGSIELERTLIRIEVARLEKLVSKAADKAAETLLAWEAFHDQTRNGRFRHDRHFEPAPPMLYFLVRLLRPNKVLETGVKFGFSTTFILEALARNGAGKLTSIDQRNMTYRVQDPNQASVCYVDDSIPSGFETGCLVPEELRKNWSLVTGRTQECLPCVLDKLGTVDLFFRDSEHTYETMFYEFEEVWPHLATQGVLVSDNIDRNSAFDDFVRLTACRSRKFSYVGFAIKTRVNAH